VYGLTGNFWGDITVSREVKIAIIALTLIFAFGVIFIGLLKDVMIITPLIFYIPIFVAAYWFPRKAVYFAMAIGGVNIAIVYLYSYPSTLSLTYTTATASFYVLVAITLIIATLSESLIAQEARYREIFNHSESGIFIVDPRRENGAIVEINTRGLAMIGSRSEDLKGTPISKFLPDFGTSPDFTDLIQNGERIRNTESALTRQDGNRMPVLVSGSQVPDGRLVLNITDISDRKKAEVNLQRSVKEKEILLREVHHRVKNNMQVISGLIELQAAQIQDPRIRGLFFESQNRIRTMALIHEILYRSNDYAHINFSKYLNELITYLLESYGRSRDDIVIDTRLNVTYLSLDLAIPCGLMANELISNCLKHAFPNGRKGHIMVTLSQSQDQKKEFRLSVSDDGIGFPPNLDLKKATSFGLQVINGIATHQMRGTVEVVRQPGTTVVITFPDLPVTGGRR